MKTHLKFVAAVVLPLATVLAAGTAHAAFTIVQAAGAHYKPASGVVACGAGFCQTRLTPTPVVDLGVMSAANTAVLSADLFAQKSGYEINAYGDKLNINFNITDYLAINDGASGGGILQVDYTGQPGYVAPENLHWIQIVTDNWNITGVNGANLSAPMGRDKPENVIDAPGVTSPYYDDASAAQPPPNNFDTTPPHFEDFSQRPEPNAASPVINWNADLYLVSDDGEGNLTVYDGVEWGWQTRYAANPAALPEPAAWGLMILGFGVVGALARRRREIVLAHG